jgi:phytanoyl-CoA hydroxylase
MLLTHEQLEQFNKNGFLILPNFAEDFVCDEILKVSKIELQKRDEPIETEGEYNTNQNSTIRRLRQVYDRNIVFQDWMRNEKIRPILNQVLGDTPVLTLAHHNSIMTKMPHESTQSGWHQDRRYWHFENGNLVSIWLALDNETTENGVLEFIPNSHKMKFTESQFDEKIFFRTDLEENQKLIDTKVSFDLKKGDVVLFHAETLHKAEKNSTDNPKISFVYTVRAKSNHPIKNTRSDFKEIELI